LLSIALLCAQGITLHVHNLGHEHDQQHDHLAAELAVKHSHLSETHLSTDASHGDHHAEVVSEFGASPDGLLKKISYNVLTLALLATVLALLFPSFYQLIFPRRRDIGVIFAWQYRLSPPLRAPPL